MKKTISALFIILCSSMVSSQITMGNSLDRANIEKEIVKAPPYENHENFLSYEEYYGYNPPKDKTPTKEEFYSRYNDSKIFFPKYSNSYREKDIYIFKDESTINLLKREFINERYFKIERIDAELGKTPFYAKINDRNKEFLETDLLFTLKDEETGEIVYVVESSISFVLVPFYENLTDLFSKTSFIATQDFSADKLPLSTKNGSLYIDKGTEWKGRFSLLRGRDINFFPGDEITNEDQDLKYMAILGNGNDTIIMNITKSNSGRWWFSEVFTPKHIAEKRSEKTEAERKEKLNSLVKKYGQNYGNLVFNKKGTIGMTKEMCKDIYGITLNKKSYTDAKGEIEIWEYTGMLKLYFTNGKLSEIIKY